VVVMNMVLHSCHGNLWFPSLKGLVVVEPGNDYKKRLQVSIPKGISGSGTFYLFIQVKVCSFNPKRLVVVEHFGAIYQLLPSFVSILKGLVVVELVVVLALWKFQRLAGFNLKELVVLEHARSQSFINEPGFNPKVGGSGT